MRIGPDHSRPGLDMCQLWTPAWALSKALGPHYGRSGPHMGGSGSPYPIIGVRSIHVGVLDQLGGSRLYIQGSGTFPWGSGLTVDALEYISFS